MIQVIFSIFKSLLREKNLREKNSYGYNIKNYCKN